MRPQDWKANYYEALRERNEAEAKLEKIASLVADLRFATGAEWVARMLDNILFPCECPGEHCGDCGCCTCLTCGHTPENHDPDDGCGACAMAMRPFRHDYRKAPRMTAALTKAEGR